MDPRLRGDDEDFWIGERFRAGTLIALLFLLLLFLTAPALAQPTFPALTGRVVDAANILPPNLEASLTQKLAGLETQSGRQLVVVTLPDLQGYDIADYGYQLGRAWGIGSKEKNDGALLIVAPAERKLRIEVGYGLEGVLTDGMSSLIINQTIVPRFKDGDLPGGIEAGADAIVAQLSMPEAEARQRAQAAGAPAQDVADFDPSYLIFAFIFLFFFVIPFFRTVRQRRRYPNAAASVFVWDMLRNMPRSGSGGGSIGSGGGFSGGGGSFGGGGSSGSW